MRASLLLLFLLSHFASSSLNWDECGVTALCRVNHDCIGGNRQSVQLIAFANENPKPCAVGIHIKPESKQKWTISIYNEDQQYSEPIMWKINDEKMFKCTGNTAEFANDKIKSKYEISLHNDYNKEQTDHAYCIFTVNTDNENDQISIILDDIRTSGDGSRKTSLVMQDDEFLADFEYHQVNDKIPCIELLEPCDDSTEVCTQRDKGNTVGKRKCRDGYISLFRLESKNNFIEADIKCNNGDITYQRPSDEKPLKALETSEAKCVQKKCTLCEPKDNFTSIFKKSTKFDECATLKCEKGFMVINNKILTYEPVQCFDVKDLSKDDIENHVLRTESAKWNVKGESTEIETAVCRESVQCQQFYPIRPFPCKDASCIQPEISNANTGAYECKSDQTMNLHMNGTHYPINEPVCETNGTKVQWKVTFLNGTSNMLNESLMIQCAPNPVEIPPEPQTASYTWVYVVVPLLLILLVAFAVLVWISLKRRNKKKAPPVPPKTSSSASKTSTKTSSKGSSDEKEPLTSAMVSVTAESMQTAREPQKPVILSSADLRVINPIPSDPSTNKEEKKEEKKSERKTEKKEEKREEKKTEKKTEKKDPSVGQSDDTDNRENTSRKEKLAPMPTSGEDPLKSQTGGDGESQVESMKKNGASAKLIPRPTPRKYSRSSTKTSTQKTKNNDFLNVTDYESDEEPSKTGSLKRKRK